MMVDDLRKCKTNERWLKGEDVLFFLVHVLDIAVSTCGWSGQTKQEGVA
jgi:DNA gyrase/topoisomerase IV subunit B